MASPSPRSIGIVTVSINYQGSRTVLYLPKNIKVGQAIQKAAEAFKIEPNGLTFLYHGNEITDDMLVGVSFHRHKYLTMNLLSQDALCRAGNVTVIHLIPVTEKKSNTATIQVPVVDSPRRKSVSAIHADVFSMVCTAICCTL